MDLQILHLGNTEVTSNRVRNSSEYSRLDILIGTVEDPAGQVIRIYLYKYSFF